MTNFRKKTNKQTFQKAYFSVYGPSYVEWLGELSCNVLFEDKYSAARAMAAMSQGLPSPPPESVLSHGKTNNLKSETKHDDCHLENPDHHSGGGGGNGETCDAEGTSMDYNTEKGESNDIVSSDNDNLADIPDLGRMGWRFCILPVRKVSTKIVTNMYLCIHGKNIYRGQEIYICILLCTLSFPTRLRVVSF